MDYRPIQRVADSEFASQLKSEEDSFPDTDKMPLDDFPDTDFQDSLVTSEMEPETMSSELYEEFEESRMNSNLSREQNAAPKERFWQFDFTDSVQDIKDGTLVTEINASEDLFNKYFNK
jgi:hypothetical protein